MVQSSELETCVSNLFQKLKKLYFNRKVNPNKKGKATRNVRKRYIVGMKEVIKHLETEKLKMVVIAVNLEKVDGQNGLNELIHRVIQRSRELKVPLIFAMTRYKLGLVTKFQGQMASIVGVFNYLGANDEYNALVKKTEEARVEFYKQLTKNVSEYDIRILKKENRYLDWQCFEQVKSDPSNFFF